MHESVNGVEKEMWGCGAWALQAVLARTILCRLAIQRDTAIRNGMMQWCSLVVPFSGLSGAVLRS